MLKLKLSLLAGIVSFLTYSQIESTTISESMHSDLYGTFQVILADKRMIEPEITESLLAQVEQARLADKVAFIEIDQYTHVKVLPLSRIESDDFEPLKLYDYEK